VKVFIFRFVFPSWMISRSSSGVLLSAEHGFRYLLYICRYKTRGGLGLRDRTDLSRGRVRERTRPDQGNGGGRSAMSILGNDMEHTKSERTR
jgi:hypothetical protein